MPKPSSLFYRTVLVVSCSAEAREITVVNTDDAGEGSLRQSLAEAQAGDSIVFIEALNGQTISLGNRELVVDEPVSIDASALSEGIIIRANGNSRVFQTNASPINTRRGGEDLASQSSVADSSQSPAFIIDGDLTNFSSTNADDDDPTFVVGFNEGRLLSSIKIHNRGDGVDQHLLRNIQVTLFDANRRTLWVSSVMNPDNRLDYGFGGEQGTVSPPITVGFPAQMVSTIEISKRRFDGSVDNSILSIGEVEFFSPGAIFRNLTITGGRSGGESALDGGGIYNSGSLALFNCHITGNRTRRGFDGANGFNGADGIVSLDVAALSGRNGGEGDPGQRGGHGAGIFNQGILSVVSSTFSKNTTGAGGHGGNGGHGGIGVGGEGGLGSGGFGGNGAEGGFGGQGGAIYNDAILSVSSSTFAQNATGDNGDGGNGGRGGSGAAEGGNGGAGAAPQSNSPHGGAIYNGGFMSVSTSTFAQNDTGGNGFGGAGGSGGEGGVESSVAGRSGGEGGGDGLGVNIYNREQLELSNSILSVEILSAQGDLGNSELGIISLTGANLITALRDVSFVRGRDEILQTDPMLRPLGDYGGFTPTMLPFPDSPVNGAYLMNVAVPPAVDQRGLSRPAFISSGTLQGLGAVQFQGELSEIRRTLDVDSDNDGVENGIEAALGSDPYTPDSDHPNHLKIQMLEGQLTLSFVYVNDAFPLKLEKVSSLEDYSDPNQVQTIVRSGVHFVANSSSRVTVVDSGVDRGFFRLSASGGE